MFAVIYRFYIKPGFEDIYQRHWHAVATYFVKEQGALGSTLHKTEDGMWVAYSRWPDKATRDASWPNSEKDEINHSFPLEIKQAIKAIMHLIDDERKIPEITMTLIATV